MIRFNCDYLEGAHPRIIEALSKTNSEQTIGYGCDEYSDKAKEYIKELCASKDVAVHLMIGGTQTNLTLISAALRPHQGVLCASSGHINVHESGAIEATGHKNIALPTYRGKIKAKDITEYAYCYNNDESREHTVQPKLVYISHPTEEGTLYSRKELYDIAQACRKEGYYLYLDGARLGYGLASPESDLDIPFINECCDAFYIGGTKIGLLFGEALVIKNDLLKTDFRSIQKQKGGMLAKGRLLGVQFCELFCDGLYFEISRHAIDLAYKLKTQLNKLGYDFYCDSPTNQQFILLSDEQAEAISDMFSFENFGRYSDNRIIARFCTSWATKEEDIEELIKALSELI